MKGKLKGLEAVELRVLRRSYPSESWTDTTVEARLRLATKELG